VFKSIQIILFTVLIFSIQMSTAANLPIEIQADILMEKMKQDIDNDNPNGALDAIDKLKALGISTPSLLFTEGKIRIEIKDWIKAKEALEKYVLTDEQKGGKYKEAIQLLVMVEEPVNKMIAEQERLANDEKMKQEQARLEEELRLEEIRKRELAELERIKQEEEAIKKEKDLARAKIITRIEQSYKRYKRSVPRLVRLSERKKLGRHYNSRDRTFEEYDYFDETGLCEFSYGTYSKDGSNRNIISLDGSKIDILNKVKMADGEAILWLNNEQRVQIGTIKESDQQRVFEALDSIWWTCSEYNNLLAENKLPKSMMGQKKSSSDGSFNIEDPIKGIFDGIRDIVN